jgi:hypothetical protein
MNRPTPNHNRTSASDNEKAREALKRAFKSFRSSRANPPPPPPHATPEDEEAKAKERERAAPKDEEIPSSLEWIDLVSLAEEPDDPALNLLGNGFLRRGGGMFLIGPTECGKSSLSIQLTVEWSCGLESAIIKTANNNTPLRVLVIQSEDDRQDAREMARCCKHLGLTPKQIELVKKNTHFARWRACGRTEVTQDANGNEIEKEISVGERLIE